MPTLDLAPVPNHGRRPWSRRGTSARGPRRRERPLARGRCGVAELPQLLVDHVSSGGKRLRPSFLLAGVLAAGRRIRAWPDAIDVGAALELLHAFALIHDDVMDGSATRRGVPTMHRQPGGPAPTPGRRGRGPPIRRGPGRARRRPRPGLRGPAGARAAGIRAILGRARGRADDGPVPGRARRWAAAVRLAHGPHASRPMKSGRYTVVRPLHLAAELAARPDLAEPSAAFGEPLGGRSSSATTCSAPLDPPRSPASRWATTSARPSRRCCSRSRGTRLRRRPGRPDHGRRSRPGRHRGRADPAGPGPLGRPRSRRARDRLRSRTALHHLRTTELMPAGSVELERLAALAIERDH